MKAEFTTYLKSIGAQDLLLKRVEEVLDFYEHLFPAQIDDILVTEYFDKDENRQYESMWLFSTTSVMEAKNFLQEDDLDYVRIWKHIKYWSIKKTEYDFAKATTKSRMVLSFATLTQTGCMMKASQANCDHLKSIFMKYVIPNVTQNQDLAQRADEGDDE